MEGQGAGQSVGQEVFGEVQQLLTELYEAYRAKTGKRRISDNQFAKFLGVSASNWNYWINGSRVPEMKNALLLAPKIEQLLGPDARLHFMQVLGYPNYQQINDQRLQVIVSAWEDPRDLPREIKEQIYELVIEAKSGRAPRRKARPETDDEFDR